VEPSKDVLRGFDETGLFSPKAIVKEGMMGLLLGKSFHVGKCLNENDLQRHEYHVQER
jgi:hypothetical protein